MMTSSFAVPAALAAALLFGGSAQAAVTFIGFQTDLNPDEQLVTAFEGGPTLADTTFLLSGFALSGDAVLFSGSTSNLSAAPATGAGTTDTTQYLSVQGGQTAFLDTPLLRAISFYVGSLDGFNRFTFHLADGTTQLVTGATLDALPFTDANGSQTGFTTNGRVTFTFDSDITGVELASGNNSLELSDVGAVFAVVPEPASWAMMILGFGGVGGLLRHRQRRVSFA